MKLHGERKAAPEHVGRGHRNNNVIPNQGNSAAYLAARLKRDHPDIAAQLANGKFKSVRAAAKAAGIIKQPTPLSQLRHWWKHASEEERTCFKNEITENCPRPAWW